VLAQFVIFLPFYIIANTFCDLIMYNTIYVFENSTINISARQKMDK